MTIWYCTREDVQNAGETEISTGLTATIDRAIAAASVKCEEPPLRRFYPHFNDLVTLPWPNSSRSAHHTLYFDVVDFISINSLTVAGTTIEPTDYVLKPVTGPPYRSISIRQTAGLSFHSGEDRFTAIEIEGTTGYTATTATIGTITESIDAAAATVTVAAWPYGVGSLLNIGSEYVKVVARGWQTTTDHPSATVEKNVAATSFTVTAPTGTYNIGDIIRVDAEKMRIEDYSSGTLHVKRAVGGSTLAAHTTAATIETLTKAYIERAQCGTTAAAHSSGDVLKAWQPPPLIKELCIAEAITAIQQTVTGYGRTVGSGDGALEARGIGLADVRDLARRKHKRVPIIRTIY